MLATLHIFVFVTQPEKWLKGTLSREFVCFGMKNVLKFKLNAFSCTQNTPRTSGEEIKW